MDDLSEQNTGRTRIASRADQLVSRAWKEARRGAVPSPEKVAMLIARDIVRQIGTEQVKTGDPLSSEVDMAGAYNVGRTSIREALRILEVQGLISIKTGPSGGPVVTDPTSADAGRMLSMHLNVRSCTFGELASARLQLDPILASQAAENRTAESLERLRDIVAMMEVIPANNNTEWARTASMFNAIMAAMSGNGVLALISSSLRAIYAERITSIQYTPKVRQNSLAYYRKIIEAIENRDGMAAQKATFSLISEALKQMNRLYPDILNSVVDWR
jgi:DNA-binding FadR family transcriptional regulator